MTRQNRKRQDKKTNQGGGVATIHDKTRQGKAKQNKTNKARQDKARQRQDRTVSLYFYPL